MALTVAKILFAQIVMEKEGFDMLKLYREYKELKAAGARVKPVWRILVGLVIYLWRILVALVIYPFYRAAQCFVKLCDEYL